ncbi:MAG: DUF2924 domain-containing protein [Alphaproteobacteria bacterium]|nr:DUF2924 domain-containing protein [Alphaproteobacteria bacterium]
MSRAPSPVVRKIRCAIYTRKSSEEGLEMEFNSLDAQREACEAYVASQGGLAPASAAKLDEMADEIEKTGSIKVRRAAAAPVVGARLVRDWQGEMHEVAVLSVGYEYRGRVFKSLSAIARTITGTRWNGPAFFGLRSGGGAS